jgi:hypothetical protein
MKGYVDQTEFSNEEGTEHGNCLSACLANLLGIDLAAIPNFAELERKWFPVFSSIIREHGYEFQGSYYFDNPNRESSWEDLLSKSNGIDGIFIAGGSSPRIKGIDHAVLYKDGEMLHDPHPSRDGILSLKYVFMIEKVA